MKEAKSVINQKERRKGYLESVINGFKAHVLES